MKKILEFIINNKKTITSLLTALFTLLCVLFGVTSLSSCAGIVKATVHRPNDTSSVQINISTGSTEQDVTPNIEVSPDVSVPFSTQEMPRFDTVYLAPRSPYPYQIRNEIVSGYRFSLRPIKKAARPCCNSIWFYIITILYRGN